MNFRIITTLIIATLLAGFTGLTVSQEAAFAQNRGARFTFAPNVYRKESHPRYPRSAWRGPQQHQPQHHVAHGAVPRGTGFLGVDPGFLKKKKSTVAHKPLTRSTTHAAMRSSNVNYKKHFGKPTALVAKQPNALKVPSKSVAAKPLRKASKRSAKPRRSVKRRTRAKRIKRRSARPRVAKAKSIKGYGKSFYTPGGHTPTSTGSRSSADVYGRVLQH